jgi:hypothetical protein
MELLTLDSNYQPSELVERFGSLIWTERYFTAGDFQIVTTDVKRMVQLLPLETAVCIRESTVPMLVEVHKIEKAKDSAPVLTITGRSFESVLERRVSVKVDVPNGARVTWVEARDKESDAAYQAIRQVIGDVARSPLAAQLPLNSPNDALSMVDLPIPSDYSALTTNNYEIVPGNLYTVVMDLMTTNHHALKAVRPALGSNKVALEIYNGADLTDIVVFDAKFDQFEDATYLLSEAGSTNWAYVFSSTVSQTVAKTTSPEPSGLARRVLYLDVSSEAGTNSEEARRTRGLMELYNSNATALFDGKIGEQVAAGYNRDYFLGDIIRLDGEYGLSENVRVSEFIRSDDSTGSKAYPTFEVVI